MTSNLSFADSEEVFEGNAALTITMLDWLFHHAHVIQTRGESCRLRQTRKSRLLGASKGT